MEVLCIIAEKGEMAESCGWVIVDGVPLLYDKRRVARQLQIETWLELSNLVSELRMMDVFPQRRTMHPIKGYVA